MTNILNRLRKIANVPTTGWSFILYAIFGGTLGVVAWGSGRTPVMAVLLPVVVLTAPSRLAAFAAALAYHLCVVRFAPEYVSHWFNNPAYGLAAWNVIGLVSAIVWAAFWTSSSRPWVVGLLAGLAFVVTLLPPWAVVMPGHPIVGWGFVLEGWAWFGIALGIAATGFVCAGVRSASSSKRQAVAARAGIALVAALLLVISFKQDRLSGQIVGDMYAFSTGWGDPPSNDDETVERIEKAGTLINAVASSPGGAGRLLVLPETAIGKFDPTFAAVLNAEIGAQVRATGQAVVLGTEIGRPDGSNENLALLIRPDGTNDYAKQRQPPLLSMWAPWRKGHFPADWSSSNILQISEGIRARVMFCYEEYIPALHLLNEAYDDHNLVIVMANGWAAPNITASDVQAAHSEGMARLFGRRYLRAENYQPSVALLRRAAIARNQP